MRRTLQAPTPPVSSPSSSFSSLVRACVIVIDVFLVRQGSFFFLSLSPQIDSCRIPTTATRKSRATGPTDELRCSSLTSTSSGDARRATISQVNRSGWSRSARTARRRRTKSICTDATVRTARSKQPRLRPDAPDDIHGQRRLSLVFLATASDSDSDADDGNSVNIRELQHVSRRHGYSDPKQIALPVL